MNDLFACVEGRFAYKTLIAVTAMAQVVTI